MDIQKYAQNVKKQIKSKEQKKDKLWQELRQKARSTASYIGKKYRLQKVILFGSITNKEKFTLNSDIDFAVKGLKSKDFLSAWGDIERNVEYRFDLVRLENAQDALKKIIIEEGEVVYESGKEESQ